MDEKTKEQYQNLLLRIAVASGLMGAGAGAGVRVLHELTAAPSPVGAAMERTLRVDLPTPRKKKRKEPSATDSSKPTPELVDKVAASLFSSPYAPFALLAGIPTALASWTLTDSLLDKMRQARLKREIEKAKKEFFKVITLPDETEEEQKKAEALDTALDKAYDAFREGFQKEAGIGEWFNALVALWLGHAALTGGLGFKHGWAAEKDKDPVRGAEKAIEKWDARRLRSVPIVAQFKKPDTKVELSEDALVEPNEDDEDRTTIR